jgi:small conductance mechanosensitive channel
MTADFWLSFLRTFLNALLLGAGGFLLAFIVARFSTRLIARWIGPFWGRFLGSLIGFGIAIWTFKVILDSTGAEGMAVVIITAVTGALALGSSMIAADLVAGLSLFLVKPYDVGQLVSLAGRDGKVVSVTLLITVLESIMGERVYIRNSDIANNTIVNYSAKPGHMISIQVSMPVQHDLNTALRAIETELKNFSPDLEGERTDPIVLVENATGGAYTIEVHAYVLERLDYSAEKTRLMLAVVNALRGAGFSLS